MPIPSRVPIPAEITWAPIQKATLAIGAVFFVVGVLGFVPAAALLGIFNVSVLHNLVHLAFGVAGVALAGAFTTSRSYLLGGGVAYLALFLCGLVIGGDASVNLVPVNDADEWLHLGLAGVMLACGVTLGRRHAVDGPTKSSDDPLETPDAAR